MSSNNEKGKLGEEFAVSYFSALGYKILHRNWRCRHFEVDIIASRENMLHFIEVKCRSTNAYGFPEQSISKKKIKNLIDASEEFFYMFPQWKRIQFDVLSVTMINQEAPEFFLIEDVYL